MTYAFDVDELSDTLKALSDPSRRRQLERLANGPATSGQLAELLTMSRPAGSQHLAVLVGAGLVQTTPTGRQRWHALEPDRLYRIRAWLDQLLTQWETVGTPTAGMASTAGSPTAVPIRSSS